MTYQEVLKKEKVWYRRVMVINLFHARKILKDNKWTIRKTAKRLDISIGAVSEAIKLTKALIDNPELEKMTRNEALKAIHK